VGWMSNEQPKYESISFLELEHNCTSRSIFQVCDSGTVYVNKCQLWFTQLKFSYVHLLGYKIIFSPHYHDLGLVMTSVAAACFSTNSVSGLTSGGSYCPLTSDFTQLLQSKAKFTGQE